MNGKIVIFIFLVFLTTACDFFNEDIVVIDNRIARVGDDILNESHLSRYQGSLIKRDAIINKWIETTLLAQAGEKLKGVDLGDIENKVKNYRNTLLSYAYKKYKLKNMDSVVTNQDIMEYYNEQKTSFKIVSPIILCRLLVTNRKLSRQSLDDLKSNKTGVIAKLQGYISDHEGISHLDKGEWVLLQTRLNNTPFQKYIKNPSLIKLNRINIATRKKKFYYLIVFRFKDKGSIAPLEYYREKIISSILLNRRKDMLKKIKEDLISEARKEKVIEIF